ncbi:Leucine-rich repeat domain, L domain-like [Phytophthora cactorum]|nr:Leucine-rich repeat domain, L domain-like [Phytophthora cactorum]
MDPMAAQNEVFTSASITETTGETDHEQLEEIEVIFGNFKHIDSGALRKCRNLQKFTMVNCNLEEISSLEPLGASLVHLCLSNQNISKISGLSSLHELRHLYLQQNNISRIEGLERCGTDDFLHEMSLMINVYVMLSCRKLKTLWLYDNCLTTVDNLGFCTNLRELWLQRLNLANNRIRDVDEFEHLRKLIVLRQLSFTDEHFGSNPIVYHPDYRSCAITIIKQLRQLDGTLVGSDERSTAEDQFFTQV